VTRTDQASERESIMTAAYDLLAASGGTSVSVTEILARAGLSTRAFYRHFDSRDGLLTAMFRRDSERVVTEMESRARTASTGRAALEVWVTEMLALAEDPRRRRRAIVLTSEEVSRARGYQAEEERHRVQNEQALARILERGSRDGTLPRARPVPDAAHINAALLQSLNRRMSEASPAPAAAEAASLLDFVLRALTGAAPPTGGSGSR
jgi:AcrR family transcriptional regulator